MIKSALQSSLTNDVKFRSMSVGNLPSSEYLIQSALLTQSETSIVFDVSGLGSQFRHLQLVWIFRDSRSSAFGEATVRFNGDSASNYREHNLRGDGNSVTSASYARSGVFIEGTGNTAAANSFAGGVMDILDAFNANKNTVVRYLSGRTGDNFVALNSTLWVNTAPLTSITISPTSSASFLQGSRFSLYGVTA